MGDHFIRPLEIFSELYIGDYFTDTLEFTAAEHSAFRLLLMRLWLTGALPSKGKAIAKIANVPFREWSAVQKTLNPLLVIAATKIAVWKQALTAFDGKRLPPEHWRVARAVVLERDGYTCAYCGSENRLHVDHRIALSRSGSNSFDNLVTCCGPCNWSKGSKLLTEWSAPP